MRCVEIILEFPYPTLEKLQKKKRILKNVSIRFYTIRLFFVHFLCGPNSTHLIANPGSLCPAGCLQSSTLPFDPDSLHLLRVPSSALAAELEAISHDLRAEVKIGHDLRILPRITIAGGRL